jgi:hypothetical protein
MSFELTLSMQNRRFRYSFWGSIKGRKNNMLKIKSLISVMLLVFFIAAPIIAAEEAAARFAVVETLYASGTEIKPGKYDVKWDDKGEVTFGFVGKPGGIKIQGKIEEVDKKFDYNSMATAKDASGRQTIKQLQFRGKNIRIVFE